MGYYALPTLELGDNPFEVYLLAIRHQFREQPESGPTDGFKLRLAILLALTAIYTLAILAYIPLVLEQNLKRYGGGGIWLFRKTPIQGDLKLITTNMKMCLCIFPLLQGIVIFIYLADSWIAYAETGSWKFVWVLRALLALPTCCLGYLISFGALQAFIITIRDTPSRINHVKLINRCFVGGGIAFILVAGSGAIWQTVQGTRYYNRYKVFTAYLNANATSWPDNVDSPELGQQVAAWIRDCDLYRSATTYFFASLPALAILIFCLNIASILLTRTIGARITENVDRLHGDAFANWATSTESNQHEVQDFSAYSTSGTSSKKLNGDAEEELETSPPASPLSGRPPLQLTTSPASMTSIGPSSEPNTTKDGAPIPKRSRSTNKSTSSSNNTPYLMSEIRAIALTRWDQPGAQVKHSKSTSPHRDAILAARSEGVDPSKAARIIELQKAKSDLTLIATTIAALTMISLGVALFVVISLYLGLYFNGSWEIFEGMTMSFPWGLGACFCPAVVFLVRVQWRARQLWKVGRRNCVQVQTTVIKSVDGPGGSDIIQV